MNGASGHIANSFGLTDFVTWRTLRTIWVLPTRLWMNWVLVVPNARSTNEPNRALAGGRAFLVHYVALAICFVGPLINPAAGLPPWLGLV